MKITAIPAGLSMAVALATASTMADAAEEWEFSLAPLFLWGISIEGDTTINGLTAPLDLDFQDDVLENMEGSSPCISKQGVETGHSSPSTSGSTSMLTSEPGLVS